MSDALVYYGMLKELLKTTQLEYTIKIKHLSCPDDSIRMAIEYDGIVPDEVSKPFLEADLRIIIDSLNNRFPSKKEEK